MSGRLNTASLAHRCRSGAVHPIIARSEAKKQSRLSTWMQSGLLRFARNDVGETGVRLPAAEFARVLLTITLFESRGSREGRVAAAPGAPAQRKFARAREPQVQTVTTGLPCAVVYGLYELSSVNHPVCHRRPRDAQASSRTWRRTLGRQDHTTSPSVNESRSSDSTFTSTASPPHMS